MIPTRLGRFTMRRQAFAGFDEPGMVDVVLLPAGLRRPAPLVFGEVGERVEHALPVPVSIVNRCRGDGVAGASETMNALFLELGNGDPTGRRAGIDDSRRHALSILRAKPALEGEGLVELFVVDGLVPTVGEGLEVSLLGDSLHFLGEEPVHLPLVLALAQRWDRRIAVVQVRRVGHRVLDARLLVVASGRQIVIRVHPREAHLLVEGDGDLQFRPHLFEHGSGMVRATKQIRAPTDVRAWRTACGMVVLPTLLDRLFVVTVERARVLVLHLPVEVVFDALVVVSNRRLASCADRLPLAFPDEPHGDVDLAPALLDAIDDEIDDLAR